MKKRLKDLSYRSYNNSQFLFTDFLGMAELSDFWEMTKYPKDNEYALSPSGYTVFGGYEDAERCMIRFGSEEDLGYSIDFPIICLKISPLNKKFADELSHRDFLGALMNLGIERDSIGDILVKDRECYVFVKENLSDLICQELIKVKHTTVLCTISNIENESFAPILVKGSLQVASARIDGFLSKLLKISRNSSAMLFMSSKVFVNGRQMSNESYQLKEGDVISVRGFGKFNFLGISGNTRKGNLIVTYEKYE